MPVLRTRIYGWISVGYRIHGEINTIYDTLLSFYNYYEDDGDIEKMSACTSTIMYTRLDAADAIVDANQRQMHDYGIPWSNGTCYLFTHSFQKIQRYRVSIQQTATSEGPAAVISKRKTLRIFHTRNVIYIILTNTIFICTKFQNRFDISE